MKNKLSDYKKKVSQNPMSIIVPAFVAFGGIIYGYDVGTISGIIAMPCFLSTYGHLESNNTLNVNGTYVLASNDKALIVSIASLGTLVGSLLSHPLADYLGRRWGLILSCLVFSIGVSFEIAAIALPLFVIGRVVAGIGIGIISSIAPMYQSECAPKWIRGLIVSAYQLFATIGLLIAAIVSNGTKDLMSDSCYRIPIGIQLIWSAILCIGMLILPESPRYLVMKNRINDACKAQSRLFSSKIDDPKVDNYIQKLMKHTELMKMNISGTYRDCFRMGPDKNLLRTLVGISLQAWGQLTGVNFIFYYETSFFGSSGLPDPFLLTIATNIVFVGMTIPGMLLMDKLGRRKILIIGAIGMSVCHYLIAIIGTIVGQSNIVAQKALIAFVCISIAFFASSWGVGMRVIPGEIYPISIRAKCMSLLSASNCLFNFALIFATPYMIDTDKANLGSKIFFVWGSTCVGCLIFAIFCIWETKGLSLEQVDYLVRDSSPLTSARFNKQLRSQEILQNDTTDDTSNDPDIELPKISTIMKTHDENLGQSSSDGEKVKI